MANKEIGENIATPPPVVQEEVEMPLQQQLAKEGWALSDDFGRVELIDRKETKVLSLGFMGYNGTKKVVLTTSTDNWEGILTQVLGIISGMKSKT